MRSRYVLCLAVVFFSAALAYAQQDPGSFAGFGRESDEAKMTVTAEFTAPKPDKPASLFITAKLKPGWHIYSLTQPPGGPLKSKIKLDKSADYRLAGDFQPISAPEKKVEAAFGNITVESHAESVTWHAPIELAAGINPASLEISGAVNAQLCDPNACLPPKDFPFIAVLGAGVEVPELAVAPSSPPPPPPPEQAARTTRADSTPATVESGDDLPWRPFTLAAFERLAPGFDPEVMRSNLRHDLTSTTLGRNLVLAFLGGIILNLMPCVLPVIGLKLLTFVEQAGHDRGRALALNIWYSLGLISVFLLLAGLAVSLSFGWGHLFKFAGFNITVAAVIFAMGLSFLGVWEVPIPGFIASGKTAELAQSEGMAGAFAKGVVTTILATPCTGPFMGSALAWAVNQPPLHTFAVFGSVGLGMASPYLLIGAVPELIRFLPKPGPWMETLKKIMGFVLLATVVYIFTFLETSYIVPTVGLLFSLWAACWWIGRDTLMLAEPAVKARAWLWAAAFVGVLWILLFPGLDAAGRFSFHGLREVMAARQERSAISQLERRGLRVVPEAPVDETIRGPRTVLIDFTADWCLTCKTLEAAVLNTAEVRDAVQRNKVVTLQADWTHEAPEVTQFLDWLGSRQVPVIAIFPADKPNDPIVFRDGYTKPMILEAIQKASGGKGLAMGER